MFTFGPIENYSDPSSRNLKKKKYLGYFLISIVIMSVLSVGGYLVWFSYQGTRANSVSQQLYEKLATQQNIDGITCENNGYLKIKLDRYEETFGKPESSQFSFSKRKRGERIPEKIFMSHGEVTRQGMIFESIIEVHRIDSKYKICAVEETFVRNR